MLHWICSNTNTNANNYGDVHRIVLLSDHSLFFCCNSLSPFSLSVCLSLSYSFSYVSIFYSHTYTHILEIVNNSLISALHGMWKVSEITWFIRWVLAVLKLWTLMGTSFKPRRETNGFQNEFVNIACSEYNSWIKVKRWPWPEYV